MGNSGEAVPLGKGNKKEWSPTTVSSCRTSLALEKEGSSTSRGSDTQWLDEANVIEVLKAITWKKK